VRRIIKEYKLVDHLGYYFTLPWYLSMKCRFFGFFYLIILPVILFQKNRNKFVNYSLFASITGFLLYYVIFINFAGSLDVFHRLEGLDLFRYCLFLFPIFSIAIGYGCEKLFYSDRFIKKLVLMVTSIYIAIFLAINIVWKVPRCLYIAKNIKDFGRAIYEDNFLLNELNKSSSFMPSYSYIHKGVIYANRNLPQNSLILNIDARCYYMNKNFINQGTASKTLLDFSSFQTKEDFINRCKELKITHIFYNKYKEWYNLGFFNFLKKSSRISERTHL
jgi:hypothetical protein